MFYTLKIKPVVKSLLLCFCLLLLETQLLAEKKDTPDSEGQELFRLDMDKAPTYVKSESLTVRSKDGVFEYLGNVELKHGDLTVISQKLEGKYDQNNEIETLTALQNVIITKGENIRATSQKALYERKTETMTLTENPELQEGDSVLSADLIRIFLEEDRSVAEGQVRVKLIEKESKDKKPAK